MQNNHEDFLTINQRALTARLDVVRKHLCQQASRVNSEKGPEKESDLEADALDSLGRKYGGAVESAKTLPVIEALSALFGLSEFERNVLLLCAGMELQASFAAVCADAQGDPQRPYPTFGLALAAFPEAHWSALAPNAPLRYWRLIEFASSAGLASAPLTTRPLRIDERILHCLCGIAHLDERLAGSLEPVLTPEARTPTQEEIAERAASVWAQSRRDSLPVIFLCGETGKTARAVAALVGENLGLSLYSVGAHRLPSTRAELDAFVRLCERESLLSRTALLIEYDDDESADSRQSKMLDGFIEQTRCPFFVVSRGRRQLRARDSICFDLPVMPSGEQRTLWQTALADRAAQLDGQLDTLVSQFNLAPSDIVSVAKEAALQPAEHFSTESLWDACRRQTRARLEALAQRIEPAAAWDDLILPPAQKDLLHTIATHVRHRAKVYDQWGFAGKGARGLGISALFAGASGTGKTMAAEVLAQELRLDLYRIDLSSVVSKYIGETEKNLRQLFDAAESGGAILLFDEADALFGKRSEVKDSHDRYANIEVSYLLQRMESYRGLAILTTNLKSALDTAFLRRIRFVVQFPFPDAADREAIWRGIFPKETPLNGVAFSKLAQLNVAGGNIRNIAMNAAFLAADEGEKIGMAHMLRAAQCEYAKMERVVTESEIVGWVGAQCD
ncbi:MAG: ATP-binding protein [Blastocatellales bacterium]